jgi:hypothetical protein
MEQSKVYLCLSSWWIQTIGGGFDVMVNQILFNTNMAELLILLLALDILSCIILCW